MKKSVRGLLLPALAAMFLFSNCSKDASLQSLLFEGDEQNEQLADRPNAQSSLDFPQDQAVQDDSRRGDDEAYHGDPHLDRQRQNNQDFRKISRSRSKAFSA